MFRHPAPRTAHRTALAVVVCCLLGAASACGDASKGSRDQPRSTSGAAAPTSGSSSPQPSASAGRSAPATELTLAFAGDVHFTGRTAGLLSKPETAFGKVIPLLSGADLTVLNLETAVTERGTPEPKTFHFRAPASTFTALRAAGVDAVSLANNHSLDYGQVGFADTLDNAERAKFPVFGAGRNVDQAYAPLITEVRGVRIALLGFSQIRDLASTWVATASRPGLAMAWDVERATAAVRAARQQADVVVVFNHWGEERNGCPTTNQKTFASQLADAGADLIIGAHAHTLQGDGYLGGTYVAYGLGNFLWYSVSGSTDTGVLRVTVAGRSVTRAELVPAIVSSTGQPVPLTGAEKTRVSQRFAGLRGCTGLASTPS